nr:MAG TPA: hypothetical protein [Caudoviricetes sp.]
MHKYITKSQLQEIGDAVLFGENSFHLTLKKYTGIEARPYTAYLYYDDCGNFIGDGERATLGSLLEVANIEVRNNGA